jgi:hypothetical protein
MKIAAAPTLILLLVWPATGQAQQPTKDQCEIIANSLLSAVPGITAFDKSLSSVDWSSVTSIASGQFRASAEAARVTQANLADALKRYLIALQDVTYQAQLCAR